MSEAFSAFVFLNLQLPLGVLIQVMLVNLGTDTVRGIPEPLAVRVPALNV